MGILLTYIENENNKIPGSDEFTVEFYIFFPRRFRYIFDQFSWLLIFIVQIISNPKKKVY